MAQYDVAVIGTGPAGQKAAIQAAKLGRRVIAIERHPMVGGGGLSTGTIPSKTLREAVLYLTGFRQRGLYGVSYRAKQDISIQDLTYRVDHVLQREVAVVENQLIRNGVSLVRGRASFVDAHTLQLLRDDGESRVTADIIIIAVGSHPAHSPDVPIDGRVLFDTNCILSLETIPRTMTVVGAGVIGVEYACIFAALGVRVTLVEKQDHMLDFVDKEIVDALIYQMRDSGVTFRLGEDVTEVSVDDDGAFARTASKKLILGDTLLYTIGRHGATEDLELGAAGIEADERGRIKVDDHYRTAVPHIYAAGDVIGFPALAATSMEQGRVATRYALGEPADKSMGPIPYGIYTVPEISIVGMTEHELTADAVPYEVGVGRYAETARGQIVGDTAGRLKLLVHSETRKLLGVHVIGEGATELVHIGQAVITLGGTLDYLVNNVFNYPTLAECYKVAALDAFNKLAQQERHIGALSRDTAA